MQKSSALAAKVLAGRAQKRDIVLDPRFEPQNAFVADTSRFIAVQCTRRAGKTNGLALRFFNTMDKHPGAQCVYMALTRESAKDIMWPVLQELDGQFSIGCTFTESKLEVRHPNGSTLKLYGADMKNFIKRLKGRKYPGIAIDEAQDFGVHLQSLIDDVLTPSMVDYADGWLALTGTPGPVPSGYFFDVTHSGKYGYSIHKWTILDNIYIPAPEAFITDLIRRHQWADNNPTLMREWRNQWVLDVESLWIRYKAAINDFKQLPTGQQYTYILGIDLGYNDADALAVLAWSETDPTTYLVEERLERKQGITELVEQISALQRKYNISRMVIDEGGLGKKLAEEMRRRHAIPVHAADKQRKQETVEFLNDSLRLGKLKAKADSVFAQDSYRVQIDWEKTTPDKIVIKKHPHSDIIDAVIYAYKESPAYAYKAPLKQPPKHSTEWYKLETDRMEELVEARLKAEEDMSMNEDSFWRDLYSRH